MMGKAMNEIAPQSKVFLFYRKRYSLHLQTSFSRSSFQLAPGRKGPEAKARMDYFIASIPSLSTRAYISSSSAQEPKVTPYVWAWSSPMSDSRYIGSTLPV
jgi:hypothetical protein